MALGLDYQIEQEKLKRRRQIADAIIADSLKMPGGTQMVSGRAVSDPYTPIAKVAEAYFGGKQNDQINKDVQTSADALKADTTAAIGQYDLKTTPRQAIAAGMSEDASGNVTEQPAVPAFTPSLHDRRSAAFDLAGQLSGNPAEIGKLLVADALKPQGKIADINPKDYTPESIAEYGRTGDPATLRAVAKPAAENKTTDQRNYEFAVSQGYKGSFQDWLLQSKKAGATSVSTTVSTGKGFADKVPDMVEASKAAAQGAIDTIGTTNRIREAIATGNVNLGPGATVQQYADQLALKMGWGGATTADRLVKTQQVTRGLAQFTLDARKALKGQGTVSDYEGRLLERAASGGIADFTQPELQAFLAVTDRIARKTYVVHAHNIELMKTDPDQATRNLTRWFEVGQLPKAWEKGDQPGLVRQPDGSYKYTPTGLQ